MESQVTQKGQRLISFGCFLRHLTDEDMMVYLKYSTREHGEFFPMFMSRTHNFRDWLSMGFPPNKSQEGLQYWQDKLRHYETKYGFTELVNN